MIRREHITAVILLLAAGLWSGGARGATIHVPDDAGSVGEALSLASYGDTVLVACGTYYEHDLTMRDGVCLSSATATPDCVTLDAQRLGRVMSCDSVGSDTRIRGITFTGGYLSSYIGRGGAFWCARSELVFADCDFIGNESAHWGGAIEMYDSTPEFSRCRFIGNSAGDDGGAVVCQVAGPAFMECLFDGNSCGDAGGAVWSWWYSPSVFVDCVFTDNSAGGRGGAAAVDDTPSPTFLRCAFVGNATAGRGGGIALDYSTEALIQECTFALNEAGVGGGCVSCGYQVAPVISNSILAFSLDGGVMYCVDGMGADPTVEHCCVYGNAGGDGLCGTPGENLFVDPLFCDMAGDDVTLCANSVCPEGAVGNPWGEQIGAYGIGCGDCATPVESVSWGRVKVLYR